MYHRMFTLFISATLLTSALVVPVRADSWALPEVEKYYSANKNFYLEVTPKKLESQLSYFQDKVDGKDNAGAVKEAKENHAKASFYARNGNGSYKRVSSFPLVNEVSPVSAIVSDQGDYVVTFDNWHSVGYGDDAIVIYRADGKLVKKFGLEELLTEGDIATFSRSVSSMWWSGEHYIDATGKLLVLKIVSNRKSAYDDKAQFHELKIELSSGTPLEPKRDLFPQPDPFQQRILGIECKRAGRWMGSDLDRAGHWWSDRLADRKVALIRLNLPSLLREHFPARRHVLLVP